MEGVEFKAVSKLHLEEAEVLEQPSEGVELSEQPSEGVLGEGLEWKEHTVALGTAGMGSE